MTDAPVRAAIIGLGRMGSTFDDEVGQYGRWQPPHAHAACFRAVPGVTLVAGADPYAEQRAAFSAKWGVSHDHLYDDYRTMLAREQPEIVSVCTATTPRARIIHDIAVANAGVRAIWAEKPLAISLAEADDIVSDCRRAGILLAVGASRCWDATYNRMRELIDAGAIGQVLQVNGFGSCMLSHNGSHLLTLVRYLAGGDCVRVSGHVHDDGSDRDFPGNGYLQFANGVQAFIRTMPSGAAEWEFDVIGTEGRLRALYDAEEVEFWQVVPPTLPGRRAEPVRRAFPRPVMTRTANARIVEDILTGLITGKEPNCNGEAARQALEMAIALRESHRYGGARVDLPLTNRTLRILSSETLHGDEPVAFRRGRQG